MTKIQEVPHVPSNVIDAAQMAPSAGNGQPLAFAVATKAETKQRLSDAAYKQRSLIEATFVIVLKIDVYWFSVRFLNFELIGANEYRRKLR